MNYPPVGSPGGSQSTIPAQTSDPRWKRHVRQLECRSGQEDYDRPEAWMPRWRRPGPYPPSWYDDQGRALASGLLLPLFLAAATFLAGTARVCSWPAHAWWQAAPASSGLVTAVTVTGQSHRPCGLPWGRAPFTGRAGDDMRQLLKRPWRRDQRTPQDWVELLGLLRSRVQGCTSSGGGAVRHDRVIVPANHGAASEFIQYSISLTQTKVVVMFKMMPADDLSQLSCDPEIWARLPVMLAQECHNQPQERISAYSTGSALLPTAQSAWRGGRHHP